MTATIEIPDSLYQKVAAKTARHGKDLRDVTLALYVKWVSGDDGGEPAAVMPPGSDALAAWFRAADAAMSQAPAGLTAREQLLADRTRGE